MHMYAARSVGLAERKGTHAFLPRLPGLPRPPALTAAADGLVVQRTCAKGEEETPVSRFAAGSEAPVTAGGIPSIVGEVNRSSGRPLDAGVRHGFEAAFGWSFADVRVHADDQAARAASAGNARAYTSGTHLVFAPGQLDPGSASGDRLLAHELAHVVQQRRGAVPPGSATPETPPSARPDQIAGSVTGAGASTAAAGAARSGDLSSTSGAGGSAGAVVQRWPGDGMNPPGDCSWTTYGPLRAAVELAKKATNALGKCRASDSCPVLAVKIAAIAAEIAARVMLNATCFKGGDTTHRGEVQARINMLNNCYAFFTKKNCIAQLAAAAAVAATAVDAAAANTAADAIPAAEETAGAAADLAGTAATAGEVVEGTEAGIGLLDVLEVAALLL